LKNLAARSLLPAFAEWPPRRATTERCQRPNVEHHTCVALRRIHFDLPVVEVRACSIEPPSFSHRSKPRRLWSSAPGRSTSGESILSRPEFATLEAPCAARPFLTRTLTIATICLHKPRACRRAESSTRSRRPTPTPDGRMGQTRRRPKLVLDGVECSLGRERPILGSPSHSQSVALSCSSGAGRMGADARRSSRIRLFRRAKHPVTTARPHTGGEVRK